MTSDFETSRSEYGHERISPTAWTVAYGRTFSDIPYSQEIFNCLERMGVKDIPGGDKEREVAVQFEARYKLVNRLLRQGGFDQVLEIASGLSPRGIELASNGNCAYVEFDLPDVIRQKSHILQALRDNGVIKENERLHLVPGNALSKDDVMSAGKYFDKSKPVAVVTEGLLRYLTFEEKAVVTKNVLEQLRRFGGVWLTPDTHSRNDRSENASKSTEEFSKFVGRDIHKNYFSDEADAKDFFVKLGFQVEVHPFVEVKDELVSPAHLGLTPEQVDRNINFRSVFSMSPQVNHEHRS